MLQITNFIRYISIFLLKDNVIVFDLKGALPNKIVCGRLKNNIGD